MWDRYSGRVGGRYSGRVRGRYSVRVRGRYSVRVGGRYIGRVRGRYSVRVGGRYSVRVRGRYSVRVGGRYSGCGVDTLEEWGVDAVEEWGSEREEWMCGLRHGFAVGCVELPLKYQVFFAELLQLLLQNRALSASLAKQATHPLTALHLLLGEGEGGWTADTHMQDWRGKGVNESKICSHLKRSFQLSCVCFRRSALATPHSLTSPRSLLHCRPQGHQA